MGVVMTILNAIRWVGHQATHSVWLPFAAKAVAGAVAVAALAHVGTGAAAHLNAPPPPPPPDVTADAAHAIPLERKPTSEPTAKPSASCPCPPRKAAGSNAWTDDGKLILNLAAAPDLEKLPRIGEKRAQAILNLRAKLGRFKRVRDLLRIRGIGYRLLQKIKPRVVVDPPKTEKQK
jgi:competence protein ComEA